MYTYRWFSLWKERHQIHFNFGEWSVLDQPLLPDSNRGVTISDSGTVPGTTTTASTTDSVINDANVKNSSSTSGSKCGNGCVSSGSSVRWRKPILTIPAPYSHRFQIITDDNNSENNTTPTTTATANSESINNNSINNNSCNSKVLCGTRYYFPPPLVSGSEKEGEKEVEEGEGNKEWLCVYAYK